MSPILLALLALALLLLLRVPIGLSLMASGAVGMTALRGPDAAVNALAHIPFSAVSSFTLVVIPLFILMGSFASRGGLVEDLFAFLARRFRRLDAGLPLSSLTACGVFAAVTGSSVATLASVGRMTLGEMRRYGYAPEFSAATLAAAGTLGVLIPPSIILVVYGIAAGVSVGQLLIAGIVPGLISILGYATYISLIAGKHRKEDAFPGRTETGEVPANGAVSRWKEWESLVAIVVVFVVVIGGLYTGHFTVTEAAAIGALMTLLALTIHMRDRLYDWSSVVKASLGETARLTGMIFLIVAGATVFAQFLILARIPTNFATYVSGLEIPVGLTLLILFLGLMALGMFFDGISIILISVPLLAPLLIDGFGLSGVWLGVIMVKFVELGLITPPVGVNAYVAAGLVPGTPSGRVFRALIGFLLVDVVVIAILTIFPDLTTWLPNLMAE